MHYHHQFIDPASIPQSVDPTFQHAVDTYASETNKTASTWQQFSDEDLVWKPHPKSASVREIMQHQILSERRFFSEFLARLSQLNRFSDDFGSFPSDNSIHGNNSLSKPLR